ncbi:MAG: class I SAM-dependent methyltransferase [Candidatus Omnitrophota bacterium]
MDNIWIFILNEKGFAPIKKDNFLSYEDLGVAKLLPNFIVKRLKCFGFSNCSFIDTLDEIKDCDCGFIAVVNMSNPFIDGELFSKMMSLLEKYTDYDMCKCEGAIPGTEPDFVMRTGAWKDREKRHLKCLEVRHDTQSRYNSQVNLRKFKRIKIFKDLVQHIDGLERLTIDELMSLFSSDEVFRRIISYCEDVSLVNLSRCPHCGAEIEPLRATVSQPMIGFIPDIKPYHYQCVHCSLIVVSPTVKEEETSILYDLYYREGQGQNYFLGEQSRYQCYDAAMKLIKPLISEKTKCLDLGSGSGTFIYYTREHYPSWDVTASDLPDVLKYFKYPKEIKTKPLNFLKDNIGYGEQDLITTWEVIEHIPFSSFNKLLKNIYDALRSGGVFVFSTPDFDSPFCQAWDFYNLCPPHHLLVFSKSWMYSFFNDHPNFELIGITSTTEALLRYKSWFKYFASTSKNFESRAQAKLFLEILNDDCMRESFKDLLARKNWGMEMIVAVKKK